MKTGNRLKLIVAIIFLAVVLPTVALAQSTNPCQGTDRDTQIGECISQVYIWAIGGAGVIALIMIIIGGYFVMSAGGNAAQATKGKEFIFSSLIGIAILLGAFFILNTLNPDLVQFQFDPDVLDTPASTGQQNP